MKPGIALLLAALCFSGCSTTATLTPTSGPLASSGARPVTAKIEGIMGNSGKLSFTTSEGEFVSGEWIAVRRGMSGTNGAATARGNQGSVFDVEFEADGAARGFGKATDNRGNVYRVIVKGI